jgi:hypothetical protein
MISSLGKRIFLMHNVHAAGGQLFQTRWAMNYLAGPLTRVQIPALNQMVGASLQPASTTKPSLASDSSGFQPAPAAVSAPTQTASPRATVVQPKVAEAGSTTRPAIPMGVMEYFLPANQSFSQAVKASGKTYPTEVQNKGFLYHPVLLAQADIRILNRKYNLDMDQRRTSLVPEPDRRGVVRWDDYPFAPIDPRQLDDKPDPSARYATLEAPLSEVKTVKALENDFMDWAYRTSRITVRANEALDVYAGPEVSQAGFRQMCSEAARKGRDAEQKKVEDSYDKKIGTLKERRAREERELEQDQSRLSGRRMEELGSAADTVLSLLGGRKSSRRISSTLSKRRMTSQAKADVEESKDAIADFDKQIAGIEKEKAQALEEVNQRWEDIVAQASEITVTPLKKDVLLDLFGVAWMPYYVVQSGDQVEEVAAFSAAS